MITFRLICFLFITALLSSCQQTTKESVLITSFQASMERSAHTVSNNTHEILFALQERIIEPASAYKARSWFAKAQKIERYTNLINDQIDKLIQPGTKQHNDQHNNEELRLKVKTYADSVLSVDTLINEEFGAAFSDSINSGRFYPSLFSTLKSLDKANKQERAALLTQLKFSVSERFYSTIRFCFEQVPSSFCGFRVFSPLVTQNRKEITRNNNLEITVDVGSFMIMSQPKVNISGHLCPINECGMATYTITPSGKPGQYQIPVIVEYLDDEGRPVTLTKNVRYRLLGSL